MKLKRKHKKYLKIIGVDVIVVFASVLSFFGVVSLTGADLTDGGYLIDITPIFLGAFSIIVAFTVLKISIDENRKQAQRDRELQIRPVLTVKVVEQKDVVGKPLPVEMYCPVATGKTMTYPTLFLEVENIGQGPAVRVSFIIESAELDKDFLADGTIDTLKVNEKVYADLDLGIPDGHVELIITSYSDIYGKPHFCFHRLHLDDKGNHYVLTNSYAEGGEWFWKRDMLGTWMSVSHSKENVLEKGGYYKTTDPE